MKKIALTGSSGILGKKIKAYFKDYEFIDFEGDIQNEEHVLHFCRSITDCEALIHLAAIVSTKEANQNPLKALTVNVVGMLNILNSFKKINNNPPWMFFASSSHVYSPSVSPVSEDDAKDSFSVYGLTKRQAEQWCEMFIKEFNYKICIGRIFSYTDVDQPKSFFIPAMIEKINTAVIGESLNFSDVNGFRDFLTSQQVCIAIEHLLKIKYVGSINIGSGQPVLLKDVIEYIVKLGGRKDLQITYNNNESKSLVANITKLNMLGLNLKSEIFSQIDKMIQKSMSSTGITSDENN